VAANAYAGMFADLLNAYGNLARQEYQRNGETSNHS